MGGQETFCSLRATRSCSRAQQHSTLFGLRAAVPRLRPAAVQQRCLHDLGGRSASGCRCSRDPELGGSPRSRPRAFAERSPITYSRAIASSACRCKSGGALPTDHDRPAAPVGPPLLASWRGESRAPISGYVGFWIHSHEMRARALLPLSLAKFGLPLQDAAARSGPHVFQAPRDSC